MNAAERALWFVESHLHETIALERVTDVVGVSRYHLARMFVAVTGYPLMRYVRGRRLSIAARALADDAPDILAVALEAGYGSHEAFTRAFREQFGCTPESVRAARHVDSIRLLEPVTMNEKLDVMLEPPRVEDPGALNLAGLSEHYRCDASAGVPLQWQRFGPWLEQLAPQGGKDAYGVMYNADEDGNFDYLCGVEVDASCSLPGTLATLHVPAQRYAVFVCNEHVSAIRSAWAQVWKTGLATAGLEAVQAPFFERYGPAFNPRTGAGGFELWVPVRRT